MGFQVGNQVLGFNFTFLRLAVPHTASLREPIQIGQKLLSLGLVLN
jgi:hypothetical protein